MADEEPPEKRENLWQNRDFNVFWLGQTLSLFGDSCSALAFPLLVLRSTGSLAAMGTVTALSGAGQLVAGLAAGPLVDRHDRRKIMLLCDWTRLLLFALLPLVWWRLGTQLWLLYAAAFVGGFLGNLFGVAAITAVADLVDRHDILDANSRIMTSFAVVGALGPVVAGAISSAAGPAFVVGVDALTFGLSACSLLAIRLRPREPSAEPSHGLRGALSGLRFLLTHPALRWVTLLLAGSTLVTAGRVDLTVFSLKGPLGAGDEGVGAVLGVASLCAVAAGALAPGLRRRWGFGVCWLGAGVVEGLALSVGGLRLSLVTLAATAIGASLTETVRAINSISYRQEVTPSALLGRVTAAFWTLLQAPAALGAALTARLAERVGVPAVLAASGALLVLISSAGFLTPLRSAGSRS